MQRASPAPGPMLGSSPQPPQTAPDPPITADLFGRRLAPVSAVARGAAAAIGQIGACRRRVIDGRRQQPAQARGALPPVQECRDLDRQGPPRCTRRGLDRDRDRRPAGPPRLRRPRALPGTEPAAPGAVVAPAPPGLSDAGLRPGPDRVPPRSHCPDPFDLPVRVAAPARSSESEGSTEGLHREPTPPSGQCHRQLPGQPPVARVPHGHPPGARGHRRRPPALPRPEPRVPRAAAGLRHRRGLRALDRPDQPGARPLQPIVPPPAGPSGQHPPPPRSLGRRDTRHDAGRGRPGPVQRGGRPQRLRPGPLRLRPLPVRRARGRPRRR